MGAASASHACSPAAQDAHVVTPVEPALAPGFDVVRFAEHQPEYVTLPALVSRDEQRGVVTEWELTLDERGALFAGGRIRITILTFGQPLQPIAVEVVEP